MLAGLLPMAAFAESPETPDFTGSWSDPEFDRAQIVILRDFEAWSDDMLGETPGGNYIISMTWTNSADSFDSYRMTAHEDGTGLVYDNGLYVRYTSLDDENNEAEFLEDQGKGRFTLTEDGVLKWEDSYLPAAAEMKLTRDTVQAPSAQELADGYFRAVAAAEDGTAGAGLKRAKAVYDVYSFCFENALWLVDTDELGKNMLAARELLSKEELAAFDANEPAVTAEALRLLKEEENLDGDYHDAGVAGTMEVLREDPAVRSSVSFFLACVITLENIGEP
jgi:hypothetical protein